MVFVTALPPRPRRGRPARAAETEPRTRLSRERIVDAALAIVDAGGLDALSMRAVAQALGIRLDRVPIEPAVAAFAAHIGDADMAFERIAGVARFGSVPSAASHARAGRACGTKIPWVSPSARFARILAMPSSQYLAAQPL